MRDPHRHFSGALCRSTVAIDSSEGFHAAYAQEKRRLETDFGVALYSEGTRRLIGDCLAAGVDGCTVIAGFLPTVEDSFDRFSQMQTAAAELDFDLTIRPCLIRSADGYRNVQAPDVVRRILLETPEIESVDICGPERRTPSLFQLDLETVDLLEDVSRLRVAADLPPMEVTMHVGEEITLGPDVGVTQILRAVQRGVRRLCHAHWLWADSAAPCVVGEVAKHRDDLIELVMSKAVYLEVCPTSSAVLHGVSGIASVGLDLPVEVGTDNPALLNTELPQEIERWNRWKHAAPTQKKR